MDFFVFSVISEFAASRFLVSPRFAGMTDLRKLGASIRIHNVILESDEGVSRESQNIVLVRDSGWLA